MSGESALISTGEEVPIITSINGSSGLNSGGPSTGGNSSAGNGSGVGNKRGAGSGNANGNNGGGNNSLNGDYYGITYEQHNIKNGLRVWPVLKGSQVKLTVKRMREQVNAAGGQQFDNQQVNTTIMAPLNKWVSLGSAEGSQDSDSTATSYSAGRTFSQSSTLYIKVSIMNAQPTGEKKSSVDVW